MVVGEFMTNKAEIPMNGVSDDNGIKTRNFFKPAQLEIVEASSSDPARLSLQGVILNFKDKIAVATDGRILVQISINSPDELAVLDDVIVPKAFFGYLKHLHSSAQPIEIELEFTKKMVIVSTAMSDAGFGYIRRPIPEYRKISFDVENPISIRLNPKLLVRLQNASGSDDEGVHLTFNSKKYLSPMTVRVGGVIGSIMPMLLAVEKRVPNGN